MDLAQEWAIAKRFGVESAAGAQASLPEGTADPLQALADRRRCHYWLKGA